MRASLGRRRQRRRQREPPERQETKLTSKVPLLKMTNGLENECCKRSTFSLSAFIFYRTYDGIRGNQRAIERVAVPREGIFCTIRKLL